MRSIIRRTEAYETEEAGSGEGVERNERASYSTKARGYSVRAKRLVDQSKFVPSGARETKRSVFDSSERVCCLRLLSRARRDETDRAAKGRAFFQSEARVLDEGWGDRTGIGLYRNRITF